MRTREPNRADARAISRVCTVESGLGALSWSCSFRSSQSSAGLSANSPRPFESTPISATGKTRRMRLRQEEVSHDM